MLDVYNVNRIEWEKLENIWSTSGALPSLRRDKIAVVLCEDGSDLRRAGGRPLGYVQP